MVEGNHEYVTLKNLFSTKLYNSKLLWTLETAIINYNETKHAKISNMKISGIIAVRLSITHVSCSKYFIHVLLIQFKLY